MPALFHVPDRPDEAIAVLRESGATHVLVHEDAFEGDRGIAVSGWLERSGATLVASAGSDKLFELD